MRRIFCIILFLAVCSSINAFGITTPNIGLTIPSHGQKDWDTIINSDLLMIDSAFGSVSPASSFTTGQASITATASLIRTPTITNPIQYSIIITNDGPDVVWIGTNNSVTTITGKSIPAGSSLTIDHSTPTDIYGICASGQSSSVSWLEEAR